MVWGRIGSLICLFYLVSNGCLAQQQGQPVPPWTELPLGPVPLTSQVWLTLPTRVSVVPASGGLSTPVGSVMWQPAAAPEGWSWRRARPELNIRSGFGFTSLRLQGNKIRLRFESLDNSQQWQLQLSTEQIRMEYRWRF